MTSDSPFAEGFEKVCSLNDLKGNSGKRFIVNETEIAVFLVDKKIYAVSNICPHQQSALIYDGFLEGEYVVCPVHGWMFNLKTGKTPSGSNGLTIFETTIKGTDVYIKVKPKKYLW